MQSSNPVNIKRSAYQTPVWTINHTELLFELDSAATRVTSVLKLEQLSDGPLVLDGVDLKLISLAVDGQALQSDQYSINNEQLCINNLPAQCELGIVTEINPEANKALEGLYCSSGNFCTQCEAQGFRKITYYLDRPDVLSTFDVSICANRELYPVLLSNGNLGEQVDMGNGMHKATWHDPFPKPCYLFALVAGNLAHIQSSYTTGSGKTVQLYIYVEEHNLDQCDFAMDALKRSMIWDEQVYGLEYDLDRFMIVAVDDFNMGAMENKGLNIFNSKFVLANSETATDTDFLGVESVIAHEYFHNWTGNRVTCRDWFQLSLKEGLTVFRDQEFSADMRSRDVKRIEDVRLLRNRQFPEDAGPMAHPIRPDSYIEINNFYTLTVYEKGAEVIRMIHTLLGAEAYRAGIDLYFERYDGQAVTCDDFLNAMQDASGVDLSQFSHWYSQAGTPQVHVSDNYDAQNQAYEITLTQELPDIVGDAELPCLHIPVRLGLLNENGESMPLSEGRVEGKSTVLDVTQQSETFRFSNISSKPIPSLLRQFSAPVYLHYDYSDEELAFLLEHDVDSFNRWEAAQRLTQRVIERGIGAAIGAAGEAANGAATANSDQATELAQSQAALIDAYGSVLSDDSIDPGFKGEVIRLPGIDTLTNAQAQIDIHAIHAARSSVAKALAQAHESVLESIVNKAHSNRTKNTMGERSLANIALSLLSEAFPEKAIAMADKQFVDACNMTDRVAALSVLCERPSPQRDQRLKEFYDDWRNNRLLVDKWFSLQAMATHPQAIDEISALTLHESFDWHNPNRLRSLIGSFAFNNALHLHAADGRGYALVASTVKKLDQFNPQIAARLLTPFLQWRRHVSPQKALMENELVLISKEPNLSTDVFEIVHKALSID